MDPQNAWLGGGRTPANGAGAWRRSDRSLEGRDSCGGPGVCLLQSARVGDSLGSRSGGGWRARLSSTAVRKTGSCRTN